MKKPFICNSLSGFMLVLFLVAGTCLTVVRSAGAGELPIVRDGSPASVIVTAAGATRSAQLAAFELQHHLQLITGAEVPIVTDEQEGRIRGARIYVGESRFTRELGLRNRDFGHQEYLIRSMPGALILMGRDKEDFGRVDYDDPGTFPAHAGVTPNQLGSHIFGVWDENATCYAVYDFLEDFCGVRWYLPTELGMVYPKQGTISVKTGLDIRRKPCMQYRNMSRFSSISEDLADRSGPLLPERERKLYELRWRMGGEHYVAQHAFYGYYARHLQRNRDWFAQGYDHDMPRGLHEEWLRNRVFSNAVYPMRYYPNMCYTNEGFIRDVVESAREYFDTGRVRDGSRAVGDYFSLGTMDSSGQADFCRCPDCRELLHDAPPVLERRKHHFFWDDRASDYIFSFTNRIAREIAETHPGKYVSQLVYQQAYYPPTLEPLEPNVALSFCTYAQFRGVPAKDRVANEWLDMWDEYAPDNPRYLWLWFLFPWPGPVNESTFPPFMARNMVRQMEDYHRRGFRGVYAEPASMPREERRAGYSTRAPNVNLLQVYLTFKLAYNSSLDGEELIDEFFELFYGAAGDAMKKLHFAIEHVYTDPENYAFNPTTYFGFQNRQIAWSRLGTGERMAEFAKLMEDAKQAARTDMEKRRVALFEENIWEPMKAARAAVASQQLLSNGDFERLGESFDASHRRHQGLLEGGWLIDTPLIYPQGWQVNPAVKSAGQSEYRLIQDSMEAKAGGNYVFIRGHLYNTASRIQLTGGERINISFYSRDQESRPVRAFLYLYGVNEEGRTVYLGLIPAEGVGRAGTEWTKQDGVFTVPETMRETRVQSALVAISSHTGAYFDDVRLEKIPD